MIIFERKYASEVKRLKIAICDDEENVRIYIKKLIGMQNVPCQIKEFSSGGELLRFWQREDREPIDILFLDISMEGTDGMEAAEQIRTGDGAVWGSLPLLIFLTGYPEYMQKAFAVNAFQYLVKPVDEKEFADVFAQAVRACRRLEAKRDQKRREILVHSGNVTRKIPIDDIFYIESSNRKIILFTQDEQMECYGKISEMEEQLREGFFRIHKGYLVNMKYVKRYSRTQVWLKDGSRLMISKYKYRDFIKAYLEYISEDGK